MQHKCSVARMVQAVKWQQNMYTLHMYCEGEQEQRERRMSGGKTTGTHVDEWCTHRYVDGGEGERVC